MPPKTSKRAAKETVVVAVPDEDAVINAIAEPKKRAGRTTKPTSNAKGSCSICNDKMVVTVYVLL